MIADKVTFKIPIHSVDSRDRVDEIVQEAIKRFLGLQEREYSYKVYYNLEVVNTVYTGTVTVELEKVRSREVGYIPIWRK